MEARGDAIRVLHLEDNPVDAELVARRLADDGLEVAVRIVAGERAFRTALEEFAPQILLSDFSLPGFDGLSALGIAREQSPGVPFIFVSGTIGEERAIEALKRGAVDYVLKDNLRRLVPAIRGALRQAEATRAKELAEDMLRRSESRLQSIIDTSSDWIWECDREGRFTFSSAIVLEILGYKHHELLGRRAVEYIDPADELELQATFANLDSDSKDRTVTLRWRHKSGKTRWLERTWVALRNDNGNAIGVRGTDRDVTMRMAQEVRIRRLNRALRFVSGASSAVMRIRERTQLVKESCRLAVSVGGYAKATIYLLPLAGAEPKPIVCSYKSSSDQGTKWTIASALPQGRSLFRQALGAGQPVIVGDLVDAGDVALREHDRAELIALGMRSCIALPLVIERTAVGVLELHSYEAQVFGDAELALLKQVAANISFALQYLRSKESAEYLEYFDPLTGLANRSLYLQRVQAALREAFNRGRCLALLVLDIVDLGMVNDGLGHHAGDLLLQLVAERLKDVFRETAQVGRLIGDRFAVMAVQDSNHVADALRERIASAFAAPFTVHEHELRISLRAGIVQAPDDGTDAEALLQSAQAAVEHAKQAGEEYVRHRPTMRAKASERLSMISALRRAVSEREFSLHYQPKVSLLTKSVDGAEALLRWPSSGEASVPPNVFVPMLESLGLIDEVGRWAVARALEETEAWPGAAGGFRIAVNVSPLQLNRADFAERILNVLAEISCDTCRLEIEVTESTLMADPRRARASLEELHSAGITIAIDDFGTGHSSLRVLSGLPVDVLKIDRSFVRDITTNRSHRVIVQTTITLAESLGLKTVAEGVETEEQASLLADLGCACIQGYWVSRPASADVVARWLQTVSRSGDALPAASRIACPPLDETGRHVRSGSRRSQS